MVERLVRGFTTKCVHAFATVPECYADMIKSTFMGKPEMTYDCCQVADDCLQWVNKDFYSRAA